MKPSGFSASSTLFCQLWYPGADACFQAPDHYRLNHQSGERDKPAVSGTTAATLNTDKTILPDIAGNYMVFIKINLFQVSH